MTAAPHRDPLAAAFKRLQAAPATFVLPAPEELGKLAREQYLGSESIQNWDKASVEYRESWTRVGEALWSLGFAAGQEAASSGAKIPWCPCCGPFPRFDEEGLCAVCGATTAEVPTVAGQEVVDEVLRELEQLNAKRQRQARIEDEIERRMAELEKGGA